MKNRILAGTILVITAVPLPWSAARAEEAAFAEDPVIHAMFDDLFAEETAGAPMIDGEALLDGAPMPPPDDADEEAGQEWRPHPRGRTFLRIGHILRMLERLDTVTAPQWFTMDRFPRADLNADGEWNNAEWLAFAALERRRLLSELAILAPWADTNGDGSIGPVELAQLRERRERWIREFILTHYPEADVDGNGELSDEELEAAKDELADRRRARILENHSQADTNGDGELSDEELRAFLADHAPHRRGGRRSGDNWDGGADRFGRPGGFRSDP